MNNLINKYPYKCFNLDYIEEQAKYKYKGRGFEGALQYLYEVRASWHDNLKDLRTEVFNNKNHPLWGDIFGSYTRFAIFNQPDSDSWLEKLEDIIEKYAKAKYVYKAMSVENENYLKETIRLHLIYLSDVQRLGDIALHRDVIQHITNKVTDYFINENIPLEYHENHEAKIKNADISHVFGSLWTVIKPEHGHRPQSFYDMIRKLFPKLKRSSNKSISESIRNARNNRPLIVKESRKPLSQLLN